MARRVPRLRGAGKVGRGQSAVRIPGVGCPPAVAGGAAAATSAGPRAPAAGGGDAPAGGARVAEDAGAAAAPPATTARPPRLPAPVRRATLYAAWPTGGHSPPGS